MHTGEELEMHQLETGRLSCDSDAPQVGSGRSDSVRVVKVNRRKTNRHKTRPYCTYILSPFRPSHFQLVFQKCSCLLILQALTAELSETLVSL
jgi:hypothetical protein